VMQYGIMLFRALEVPTMTFRERRIAVDLVETIQTMKKTKVRIVRWEITFNVLVACIAIPYFFSDLIVRL
jgi:hypothetical protein